MKYIVVLGDGMADRPLEELNGKTPLETAKTPVMDELSKQGEVGLAATIPDGMKPGSDTANLTVLGYDPKVFYTGRSPLEALSIGAPMDDEDIALRVNLVTVEVPKEYASDEEALEHFDELIIRDHSSGELSTEEAKVLLDDLKKALESETFRFYLGTSYRHCLIWKGGKVLNLSQPHDHLDEPIGKLLPDIYSAEDAGKVFTEMMKKSFAILNHHPINEKRRQEGKNAANCMWFWGAGTRPDLMDFKEKTGLKGAMISAVDLLKGIGHGANMEVIQVDGANGLLETNYEGKAEAAVKALTEDGCDFVYIHVEAPDEMGHQGSIERKIKAIEYLDGRLIKNVLRKMEETGEDFRMLIMPDHATPIEIRTHSSEPIPYLIYDSRERKNGEYLYNEKEGKLSGKLIQPGYKLMEYFLNGETV